MSGHPENEQDRILVPDETMETLNAAFRSGDVGRISEAIGVVAKAHNIAEVARRAGLARPSLYRAFFGNRSYPNFTTVLSVLEVMGLELKVTRIKKRRANASRGSRSNFTAAVSRLRKISPKGKI